MGKIPFLYRMIRGAVGRQFVVKHYRGGRVVVSRFPDMSGVVATERQRVRRNLFREAVGFAKWIIGDEGRKWAFRQTLPRKKRRKVYQAALQMYLQNRGNKQWVSKQLAVMAVAGEWAIGNRQLAIRKGKSAIGKKVNGELAIVNGYEQLGPWKLVWQKGEEMSTKNITQMREVVDVGYGVERASARGRPGRAVRVERP